LKRKREIITKEQTGMGGIQQTEREREIHREQIFHNRTKNRGKRHNNIQTDREAFK
jgi:hypothetical protein